ncbi:MAG TPA: DUF362 domain-containing protein [Gemmatimonadales bacterium]|nr:DUF362 domain-containing protein [Gemmatimonadales bacterium]
MTQPDTLRAVLGEIERFVPRQLVVTGAGAAETGEVFRVSRPHRTATVALALTHLVMNFPAADYDGHPRSTQEHRNRLFADMHSFIAAMAGRLPISLGITVGHPTMIAAGPLGGRPVGTGLVIASTDALAADVVGARLLGVGVQVARHLWEAERVGLGETDIAKMAFPALGLREVIEALSEAARRAKRRPVRSSRSR